MARTRKRRRYARDEIDTLLEHFDRSGLTQVAFAKRQGVSLSTLRWWLDRRRREQPMTGPRFVPVAIADAGLTPSPGLELELGDERRIHIPVGIDREALRTLLPVVLASC